MVFFLTEDSLAAMPLCSSVSASCKDAGTDQHQSQQIDQLHILEYACPADHGSELSNHYKVDPYIQLLHLLNRVTGINEEN